MTRISAYEARTHWSALINRVASGERYIIVRRGVPVAIIGPVLSDDANMERPAKRPSRKAVSEKART
ncbi:type II toxin-antitoxin system Phd/YefM family antitoxin [Candidatus Binatus sp.]|uniref:type II toxin-antitoxin system Phd/YefM family antitoxin n=1 Tax=Candidatus Binatus sp. TaxID=2811406 RepID=UPI003C731407